ncbi:hypothetical protein [Streptomyces sp. AN091965]|uniref:hypothetical protein n=1 Tax=Streptomyces sp. AN091965 TaxID=2927803 RepID=UPI001F609F91|nr:hypothetical protein [Streptomyces sp. AN091965]MCI3934378.1 hypothetical protein [Streptomyces sp. AN091965]
MPDRMTHTHHGGPHMIRSTRPRTVRTRLALAVGTAVLAVAAGPAVAASATAAQADIAPALSSSDPQTPLTTNGAGGAGDPSEWNSKG